MMIFYTSTSRATGLDKLALFAFCAPFRLLPGKQDKLAGLEDKQGPTRPVVIGSTSGTITTATSSMRPVYKEPSLQ